MSVLIFLDQSEGRIKKNSFEAASYGAKLAENLNTSAEGIVLGTANNDLSALGKYGLKKVYTVNNEALNNYDDEAPAQSDPSPSTGYDSRYSYAAQPSDSADQVGNSDIVFTDSQGGEQRDYTTLEYAGEQQDGEHPQHDVRWPDLSSHADPREANDEQNLREHEVAHAELFLERRAMRLDFRFSFGEAFREASHSGRYGALMRIGTAVSPQ